MAIINLNRFQGSLSRYCNCVSDENEPRFHYLLHSCTYLQERRSLLKRIKQINTTILEQCDLSLVILMLTVRGTLSVCIQPDLLILAKRYDVSQFKGS